MEDRKKVRKELAIDRWLHGFLERKLHVLIPVLMMIAAALLRLRLAPEIRLSADYDFYLQWTAAYRELGFVAGLRAVVGDYYVPFNMMYALVGLSPWEPWVLTALFSSIMDYGIAWVIFLLARMGLEKRGDAHAPQKALYMAALTLFLPVVWMDSALWKQTDSFYIFFALLGIYELLRDRGRRAYLLLGISFALKLQAIFFLPFFLLIYLLKKNHSICNLLWIPGIYLLAGLPAVLAGRGLRATYGTYFHQMQEGGSASSNYGMVANYPNFYNFGLDDYLESMALPAVLVTMAVLLLSVGLACWKRERLLRDDGSLLYLLAWQIWACAMFLPSMHERYDYGAVLLFSLLLVLLPRQSLLPAAVLNIGTFLSYLRAALHDLVGIPITVLSAVYVVTFVLTTWILVRMLLERDPEKDLTKDLRDLI